MGTKREAGTTMGIEVEKEDEEDIANALAASAADTVAEGATAVAAASSEATSAETVPAEAESAVTASAESLPVAIEDSDATKTVIDAEKRATIAVSSDVAAKGGIMKKND